MFEPLGCLDRKTVEGEVALGAGMVLVQEAAHSNPELVAESQIASVE
jgi:hypothetical protein